jgi:hypothetical protein
VLNRGLDGGFWKLDCSGLTNNQRDILAFVIGLKPPTAEMELLQDPAEDFIERGIRQFTTGSCLKHPGLIAVDFDTHTPHSVLRESQRRTENPATTSALSRERSRRRRRESAGAHVGCRIVRRRRSVVVDSADPGFATSAA